jgi:hypothetical protein
MRPQLNEIETFLLDVIIFLCVFLRYVMMAFENRRNVLQYNGRSVIKNKVLIECSYFSTVVFLSQEDNTRKNVMLDAKKITLCL